MKKWAFAIAALLLLGAFDTGAAQQLEAGKWTGTVTPPGGGTMDVTFDVTLKADTIGITVTAGENGSFSFSDVKLNDRTLTYWFMPGPRVDCTLTRREDGAYEGPCRDDSGGEARMLMVPPKKE
ncbi:MAG TPA: hypothetical protein VMN60_02380 [Longimicrobiales bacterium]|nr:hypothetical protein [Longimicrobiales bacterium]